MFLMKKLIRNENLIFSAVYVLLSFISLIVALINISIFYGNANRMKKFFTGRSKQCCPKFKYQIVITLTALLLLSDTVMCNIVFNYYVVTYLRLLQKKEGLDEITSLFFSYCEYLNVYNFQSNFTSFWIGIILMSMYYNFSYNSQEH